MDGAIEKHIYVSGYPPDTDAETIPMGIDEFFHTHIEEIKTIPTFLGRRYHRKTQIENTLTRTWRRLTTPLLTGAVMTM